MSALGPRVQWCGVAGLSATLGVEDRLGGCNGGIFWCCVLVERLFALREGGKCLVGGDLGR